MKNFLKNKKIYFVERNNNNNHISYNITKDGDFRSSIIFFTLILIFHSAKMSVDLVLEISEKSSLQIFEATKIRLEMRRDRRRRLPVFT